MNDPHRILDLPYDASPEEIRERYRQLVRFFHPDRYRQDGDKLYAETKLKEINEAYEALLNQTRPESLARLQRPQPIFSPESVDFGAVAHGHRAQRRVQVGNSGATATALQFYFGDGQGWFTIVKGQRLNTAQPLPLNLDIEASTATLAPNQRYESWLEVDMDGVRRRLPLLIEVTDAESVAPASVPWLPMAAIALVVVGLLLGARTLRGPSETLTNVTSGALALAVPTATVAATSPMVEPSSGAAFSQEPAVEVVTAAPQAVAPESAGGGTNAPATQAAPPTLVATPEVTVVEAAATRPIEATASPPPLLQTDTRQTGPAQPAVAAATAPSEPPAAIATITAAPAAPEATPTAVLTATATAAPEPAQAAAAAVTVRVPDAYQVNARTETSVESISLGLLDKGAVFPAVARTIDNAWVRIVLPDGNEAWVFTESMEADIAAVSTLRVIYTDVPTAVPTVASAPVAETALPEPDAVDTQTTRTHVVQSGEFLKQLAVAYYGDEELWTLIYSANIDVIGPDPDLLTAGLELLIPTGP